MIHIHEDNLRQKLIWFTISKFKKWNNAETMNLMSKLVTKVLENYFKEDTIVCEIENPVAYFGFILCIIFVYKFVFFLNGGQVQ